MQKKLMSFIVIAIITLFFVNTTLAKSIAKPYSSIEIENYKNNDTIRYPVPLIRGKIGTSSIKELNVKNLSLNKKDPNYKIDAQVYKGRFKALTFLKEGKNKILLTAGSEKTGIIINYKPQTNPHKVRMVYFTDKTGNTTYETPNPKDNQDYRSKFDTGLKLMQTFTAERLNDLGFGRKTFNIETDDQGIANVYVVTGKLSEAEYSAMGRGHLYGTMNHEINQALPRGKIINLATVAFSKHNSKTGQNSAYTALGGGNLALFGGAIMFTWPNSLSNAQAALMDGTEIDIKNYAHDDVGRKAYWATASTTIGAALHEMGHAFGLPHSQDGFGIMTRGMDYFNRAFVFQDAPSARNKRKKKEFKDEQVARFTETSAAALVPSRFFALDEKEYESGNSIEISYDKTFNKINIISESGIAYVGYEEAGKAKLYKQPKGFPKEITFKFDPIEKELPTLECIQIRVIDLNGNMRCMSVKKTKDEDKMVWRQVR